MKRFNRYITLLLIATALISCNKFDDINTDPDATTKVTSSLLANGLLLDIMQTGGSKNFVYDNFLSKQLAWGEGMERRRPKCIWRIGSFPKGIQAFLYVTGNGRYSL